MSDLVPALASPPETALGRTSVAKGFAWNAAFSVLSKVVFPLAGLYIARTLGPALLGIAALLQMTLMLSEVLREAGLTQTYLAESTVSPELDAVYVGISLISGLIPALAVLALTPFLTEFFHQPELLWSLPFVSACLLMNAIGTVPNARLLRKAAFRDQGSIAVIAGACALFVAAIMVRAGVRYPALVAQLTLGAGINMALSLRREPIRSVSFTFSVIKPILARTRALVGANILNNLFLFCDVFVIQKLVGSFAVGLYNTTQVIAYKPADLILFPLNKTLMVAFSRSSGDKAKLSAAYWRALTAVVLLILPLYAFIASNADGIILLLLTKKFEGGIPILEVLSLYLACRTIGSTSGVALVPAGKHYWTFYPWVLAVTVTAIGVSVVSSHPTTMGIVWSFTAGAISVYSAIFLIAVHFIPPDEKQKKRIGLAAYVTAGTALTAAAFHFSSLPIYLRLALSLALIPVIHLGLAGLVFERNLRTYLSYRGLIKLWHTL